MRLDHHLVHQHIVSTRSQATDLIRRGLVLVNGKVASKTGQEITMTDLVEVKETLRFVSRAGEKLYQIMLDLNIRFQDKMVIDIGASTGGFSDCAIQHGAKRVYAYDVGKDQFDHALKNHQAIEVHEETNILDVVLPNADIILIDVSFTSIKPIIDHIKGFQGEVLALIKPQFEAGRVTFKKGVLKDKKMHQEILTEITTHMINQGFVIQALKPSALKGKMGNQEYWVYICPDGKPCDIIRSIGESI